METAVDTFAFNSWDLQGEFNRIIRQQSSLALDQLQSVTASQLDGIHEARKCFKRLRACYRLLKPSDKLTFRQGNQFFRDLSGQLSGLRDHQVMGATLARLCKVDAALVVDPLTAELVGLLSRREREAAAQASLQVVPVADRLKHFIRQQGQAGPIPFDFRALSLGISTTYAAARRGWKLARRSGEDEDYHYWRKHAKYHCYQMQLVTSLCPLPKTAMADLDSLCDLLGEHHDLAVLASRWVTPRQGNRWLLESLSAQQARWSRQTLKLAKGLFPRSPAAYGHWFARRWRKAVG
ncbi:CHAD domain-containing protein [Porticoccus sp.]